ncbi:hypothetical protein [Mycobacteroides abscessus]|uniref:hypothetical protein n=1 Tax=Mycobacteroides abscessus TaxID=36809 RepID=UPI00189652E0|nr:hypothetical protein [Mycobacteroides abscessus]
MTDLHDPYPDLPPIPPELRIDPADLTPDALTPVTTPEQSERFLSEHQGDVTPHD